MKYTLTDEVCSDIIYLERKMIVLSIAADIIRGHTDSIVLANLLVKDSYGYEINKNIKLCSDGKYELNEATLYTAFKRLEDNGCINSYWGTEATNARRKYYHITEYGKETYRKLFDEWQTAKAIIDKLYGGVKND